MLSCEFCEISKSTLFIEHLWWLLLYLILQNLKDTEDRLKYFFGKIMNENDFNDFDAIIKHKGDTKNCFCYSLFFKK